MKEIRLLIVDDHQIILDGLTSLLSDQEDIRVVETATNGREAIEILKILTVDVILMDIDMPVMNGIDAAAEIKKQPNTPKIIILSMHMESGMIRSLIETGVDGYLFKNSGKEETIKAIRDVDAGKKVFSSDVTLSLSKINNKKVVAGQLDVDLTNREIEILKLIAEGYSNKEIGEKLFISHRTVDTHRTNMMKKLDVNNIAGLISFAIRNKLV
jgi:DNA-binding NarL/FixJ family response regulator